jgi:hypothetical protein
MLVGTVTLATASMTLSFATTLTLLPSRSTFLAGFHVLQAACFILSQVPAWCESVFQLCPLVDTLGGSTLNQLTKQ